MVAELQSSNDCWLFGMLFLITRKSAAILRRCKYYEGDHMNGLDLPLEGCLRAARWRGPGHARALGADQEVAALPGGQLLVSAGDPWP